MDVLFYFKKILNGLSKYYWENKVFFCRGFSDVRVEKPIFLLGTQGGGLTLISRILRRDPRIVSSTGNFKYWAGRDEMQNIFYNSLPENFKLGIYRQHDIHDDDIFGQVRSWNYATDQLIDSYRRTEADLVDSDQEFLKTIKKVIKTYRVTKEVRFIDKSQSYTLKVPLIRSLLPDAKFILVSRNPYVMVWRAANNPKLIKRLKCSMTLQERLKLYSEHWNNSFELALDDLDGQGMVVKYEDFLEKPKTLLKKIFNYIEIDDVNIDKILPQNNYEYPYGSISKEKWYPIKSDINQAYLDKITPEAIEIINSIVRDTAKRLGYEIL